MSRLKKGTFPRHDGVEVSLLKEERVETEGVLEAVRVDIFKSKGENLKELLTLEVLKQRCSLTCKLLRVGSSLKERARITEISPSRDSGYVEFSFQFGKNSYPRAFMGAQKI